jgi:hypothetical protein
LHDVLVYTALFCCICVYILYFSALPSVCVVTHIFDTVATVCYLMLYLSCAHHMASFPDYSTLCVCLDCCGMDNDLVMSCVRKVIF